MVNLGRNLMLILLALLLAGCGSAQQQPGGGAPPVEAVIIAPSDMRGGSDAVWRVNVNGFNGPFTILWDFGGGAVVNEHSFANELSPNLLRVGMINPGTEMKKYTATVNVTDKVGATDTTSFQYIVGPPGEEPPVNPPPVKPPPVVNPPGGNQPPVIEGYSIDGAVLTVYCSDADGDEITVTLLDEFGGSLGELQGPETVFEIDLWNYFWLQREIGLTIEASDGSETATESTAYMPQTVNIANDALYAVATATTAREVREPTDVGAGNGVRVIVFTGPTKWPFQRLAGIAVTCEDGSDYVRGSFDAGIPDSAYDAAGITGIDGIWASMDADELEVTPDEMIGGIHRRDLPGSRGALDFSIIPLGASELEGEGGVLFSFELAFSQRGEYRIGFQPLDIVSRTYYQSGNQLNDYFWGDITNTEVPNTITVE